MAYRRRIINTLETSVYQPWHPMSSTLMLGCRDQDAVWNLTYLAMNGSSTYECCTEYESELPSNNFTSTVDTQIFHEHRIVLLTHFLMVSQQGNGLSLTPPPAPLARSTHLVLAPAVFMTQPIPRSRGVSPWMTLQLAAAVTTHHHYVKA